jgi:NADPH:quinone reductase-like Zn-dependent oxidoreductase
MKAFVVERYGAADTVRASDVPEPQVGDDDVLVRIHAASVNPLDLKTRDGELKVILPYRAPFVLGNDLAIQLAKHLGAYVATTTSTANITLAKSLGADVVVDYTKQAFETILHDYDVVLDTPSAATPSTSPCMCSSPAGSSSASPGHPTPRSPKNSAPTRSSGWPWPP